MSLILATRRSLIKPPPLVAAPAGPTTVFEVTLAGLEAGWGGFNLRDVISAANLSAATGQYARVTTGFNTLAAGTVITAYIGQGSTGGDAYDATALTQLTGGGWGAGTYTETGVPSDPANDVFLTSGWVLLNEAYDETKDLIISVAFTVSAASLYKLAGNSAYYHDASHVATANGSGFTPNGSFTMVTSKIEIQATP